MGKERIDIIGGGLAGSQAAVFLAQRGYEVYLYEMRPEKNTDVHKSGKLSELVCSNSLKSEDIKNASGVLKEELKMLGCELLQIAYRNRVPAGMALAVDREKFADEVTLEIEKIGVSVIHREIGSTDEFDTKETTLIIATGPMTTDIFMESIMKKTSSKDLFFFDAVSPIIDSCGIDMGRCFTADRHSSEEGGDYINCPLDETEYEKLVYDLVNAQVMEDHTFERKYLFERCQPIEEIARSGRDALRFGPLKPVGLTDPNTGKESYAVIQLRQENTEKTMYNLVGFQTRMKWGEQKRIVNSIPGLEKAEILRYGVMHKNTYINSPAVLNENFSMKTNGKIFFAGQITGVEGYVECIASGLYVAMNVDRFLSGRETVIFPESTMIGGLMKYVTGAEKLKPMYANFGLLPEIRTKRKERRLAKAQVALQSMKTFLEENKT